MSYTVIAQENVSVNNATGPGSKEIYTFEIHERFADPETVTEIGIEGEPLFVMGSSGNDMFYPFWPIQIQFTIKDQLGWHRKFDSRNKKDFKLIVKNGQDIEFDLFLYLPSSDSYYYESSPNLELIATNGLGLLKEEYYKSNDEYIELSDFILECRNRLGYDYDVHFYSKWASQDNSKTFPLGYRVKRLHLSRFTEERRISYWQVLSNFCDQFNLQLYQVDNSWLIIERKERLIAPENLNGVDLETENVVQSNFRQILTDDEVVRKPKQRFKSGLKEIKSIIKIGDELFKNINFQESYLKNKSTIPGQPYKEGGAILPGWIHNSGVSLFQSEGHKKITFNNFFENAVLRQKANQVLVNIPGVYEDKITLNLDLRFDSMSSSYPNYRYIEILFHTENVTARLAPDMTWEEVNIQNPSHFITPNTQPNVNLAIEFSPPSGYIGYLEVNFVLIDDDAEEQINSDYKIHEFNISSTSEDWSKKFIYNSRGLKNTNTEEKTYSISDVDVYGFIYNYEFYNQQSQWVEAPWISNIGTEQKIYECAPYDRLCQANKEKVEHANLSSLKYLCPDFTKTIVLKDANEVDLNLIPLEYKWNMVTGQIEIYGAEAFEDKTGITRLAFYSEEEYEDIDAETIIADDGQVFFGYTRGADSQDDRGFEVEFDAPQSVTPGTHIIEVSGVNYELETLILEEL